MAGIQLGGLSSGLDTSSIVSELMSAEQVKVDKVVQQRLLVEYRREAYINLNDKYAQFVIDARKLFGVQNSVSMSGMLRPSAQNSLSWINKASSSNTNLISAQASSSAKVGTYEFKVKQLAENIRFASQETVKTASGTSVTASDSFSEQFDLTEPFVITTDKGTFDSSTLTGTESMKEVLTKLNEDTGMSFSFDYSLGRLFVQSEEMGSETTFQISGDGAQAFLDTFHLETQVAVGETLTGKDAVIDFNGASNLTFNSNKFEIQGITLQLNGANLDETVTINVDTDIDAVVSKIQDFATLYNNLVEDVGSLLKEARYRDYDPLTDSQKDEMTEKEIELWESKSKSGMLRNDSIIQTIQNEMRSAFSQSITLSDGSSLNLYDIGIGTKSYFEGGTNGEIVIDEDALRSALSNDSSRLLEGLFKTPSDTALNTSDKSLSPSQIAQKKQESGLFNRLSTAIVNGMEQIISKAGVESNESKYRQVSSSILLDFTKNGSRSLLDQSIIDYNTRISTLNDRLTKLETRYWKQFTAMETALAKFESQSSTVSSYFSS